MILILHTSIALTSLVYTSFLFLMPTKIKFRISYTLVGLTLASGTYLVASTGAHLIQACATGLIYIGAISTAMIFARQRLAKQKTNI